MLAREAIEARLEGLPARVEDDVRVCLPLSLKGDRSGARVGLLKRLANARAFSLGSRSGVLKSAQTRSGRLFRADVRQRVVVKALVSRHVGRAGERGAALASHVAYLGRSGAGMEGGRAVFFDRDEDGVAAAERVRTWSSDRHHFRFIVSPEHGDRLDDLRSYVREVMGRVSADLGQDRLTWIATCHYDTDQPHAHVLVRGRTAAGRDLVIPRDYIGYGFRARAQEVAQERLGDLSRVDAERRIWRETQADRFTGLDRRLLASADAGHRVANRDGEGDAWAALTRGRLRHLETLGLAERVGRQYRLDADLEMKLRRLRLSGDIVRTLNQRLLETGAAARQLGKERVMGVVVRKGFHDEAGASPWAMVRDSDGVEFYARLRPGQEAGKLGSVAVLDGRSGGLAEIFKAKGADLER